MIPAQLAVLIGPDFTRLYGPRFRQCRATLMGVRTGHGTWTAFRGWLIVELGVSTDQCAAGVDAAINDALARVGGGK